jgi:hypothetical protein
MKFEKFVKEIELIVRKFQVIEMKLFVQSHHHNLNKDLIKKKKKELFPLQKKT